MTSIRLPLQPVEQYQQICVARKYSPRCAGAIARPLDTRHTTVSAATRKSGEPAARGSPARARRNTPPAIHDPSRTNARQTLLANSRSPQPVLPSLFPFPGHRGPQLVPRALRPGFHKTPAPEPAAVTTAARAIGAELAASPHRSLTEPSTAGPVPGRAASHRPALSLPCAAKCSPTSSPATGTAPALPSPETHT